MCAGEAFQMRSRRGSMSIDLIGEAPARLEKQDCEDS